MTQKRVHVFTCAALNYLTKARLLFRSLRRHHPEFVLHFALAEQVPQDADFSGEPVDELMPIDRLDIPEWRGWAFCHNIVELSTAIKPFALQSLLKRDDCERVIYLDPDIVVFSRLDDILAAMDGCNVLLTPHLTMPETDVSAIIDNEICVLQHGVYNLGFLGVTPSDESARFAQWWAQRTYRFCRAQIEVGLFTDQRWIDMVPALFEGVGIMRSSRHNTAPWNISTRDLSGGFEEGFLVDGEPLGFYHFTGFDSGAHAGASLKYARDNHSLFELIRWYQREIQPVERDPLTNLPWALATYSTGEKISAAQRVVYRDRPDLQAMFPDPFEGSGYLRWWNANARFEYPRLFQKQAASELKRMTSVISPGFGPPISARSIREILSFAVHDVDAGRRVIRRGWEILRREGLGGIRRRLKN